MDRLLIADENPDLRSALALLLETRLNVQVVGLADSMESLLTQLTTLQPDLVILDWELPGEPIHQRLAALKHLVPGLKIIVIRIRPETKPLVDQGQADGFIDKTDPPEKIIAVIQSLEKQSINCLEKGE